MPRKTKELKEIPVENTKIDNKKTTKSTKSVSKTSKKANIEPISKSKPSGTKVSKTTTAKNDIAKNKTTKLKNDSVKSKTTNSKKVSVSKSKPASIIEYYDLPYRYNQTIVKILAQTPQMLFVYWDISDIDRKIFETHYGDDFFSKTKPVLIIHNETMDYSFEIEINDFANSWYLHVNDADCKYVIELGRKPLHYTHNISTDYIYVSSSNEITAPNNHILLEKFNPNVTYKNTKNGHSYQKDFSNISNYKNMQSIYNIYDLYKTIYKNDLFNEIINEDLTNLSSSSFK